MGGFALTRPCGSCPFRSDKPFHLRPDRAQEIADALLGDQAFHCHKTVEHGEDPDTGEEYPITSDSEHCAGALIILERLGLPNQLMRIGERLGVYRPAALDMDASVFGDFDEFVEAMEHLEVSR